MGELPNEGTSFLKVSGMKLVFSKAKLKKKKPKPEPTQGCWLEEVVTNPC